MFMDYFDMGGMWMFPLLGFIVILIFIVIFLKSIGNNKNEDSIHHSESALDILNKRYAKGEITKEQYDEIKRDLLK